MKKAVALRYDTDKENAPRVVAKGKGASAENIIQLAELHNLPIHKDEDLVELLSKVELDKEIRLGAETTEILVKPVGYSVQMFRRRRNLLDTSGVGAGKIIHCSQPF